MQDFREGPNPLRPYYIPPSIGIPADPITNATSGAAKSSTPGFSFSDLDYSDYIPDASQSFTGSLKGLLDQALWKYTSVVMAQPFEVAKLVLQVRVAQDDDDFVADHPRQ